MPGEDAPAQPPSTAAVIVMVSAALLSSISLESLLKFEVAALIILPLTWAAAYLVRRIPYADRIL